MTNPYVLEACYKRYMKEITRWLPDGIIEVDLNLLHKLDLLHYHGKDEQNSALTRYFHVVESEEKLTLANEEFIVWIVPEKVDNIPLTFTLIALNKNDNIYLELAFIARGIYNNSYLVLRLLEKYLLDIQSTEEILSKLQPS